MPYLTVETTCLETRVKEEREYYYFEKPMRRGYEVRELADDILLDCLRLAYPEYREGRFVLIAKQE